jgi:prophage antirepressor-like protein
MAKLIPFHFDTYAVRVHIDDQGNPWWEAQDICAILNIHDVSKAVARLHVGEKRTSESRNVLIINESGLYRLIFRSNKPDAQRFQDWIFGEVLPAICKTGLYAPTLPAIDHHPDLGTIVQ